ncbi:MAG: hypothetical protein U0525_04090 [Patescibacteria group bacterium]
MDLEKIAAEPEKELQEVKRQTGPVEENTKHMELDEQTGEAKTAEEPKNDVESSPKGAPDKIDSDLT